MRKIYSMSTQTIERTTLSNLVYNEPYARKVLPFIKPEYFSNRHERVVFEEINKFMEKYGNQPTKEALSIELDNRKDLNDDEFKRIISLAHTHNLLLLTTGISSTVRLLPPLTISYDELDFFVEKFDRLISS